MLMKIPNGRAVSLERQNNPGRSDDAISVWRVPGNYGTRLRFCCRLGIVTVWEEPGERLILSLNIGRLAEIRRRARVLGDRRIRSLATIRKLTRQEELVCWAAAATDPETRFFETLKGGPERLGGRDALMHAMAALLESLGHDVPWSGQPVWS